jgi:putative acetyltransferase
VVMGHPEYYPRFGLMAAHRWDLNCEFSCAPEAFMAVELEAGALTGQSGVVRYRPEFSAA